MNILLFGGNGQLGWELQRSLAPLGCLTAPGRASSGHCGDLGDRDGLRRTVRALRPQLIVNAAAYTDVDGAERAPELARSLNALAPGALAQEAAQLGALFVHYSSDYVFDGSGGERPWQESDRPAPLNAYGRSKAEGDALVQQSGARHLILRTSWVYAARGANFVKTMLRLGQERERLSVVADQWGAPTGAELLADASAHAIRQLLARPQDCGLYHLSACGATNWHGYASHVFDIARQHPAMGARLRVRELLPVPASAWPGAAPRPHNSRLCTRKLQTTFGLQLPDWQTGVARMLAEIL